MQKKQGLLRSVFRRHNLFSFCRVPHRTRSYSVNDDEDFVWLEPACWGQFLDWIFDKGKCLYVLDKDLATFGFFTALGRTQLFLCASNLEAMLKHVQGLIRLVGVICYWYNGCTAAGLLQL